MIKIAERAIDFVDWAPLRVQTGSASGIGNALKELLSGASEEAYWKLENHIVVQGTVYSAAEAATAILVAAFADHRPKEVKIDILNLLYQILSGLPAQSEKYDLVERCRVRAREGLWLLVRELEEASITRDAVTDVLKLLKYDSDPFAL